jgi:hypothetical protein
VACIWEHSNEISGFMKCREFFDQLGDYDPPPPYYLFCFAQRKEETNMSSPLRSRGNAP